LSKQGWVYIFSPFWGIFLGGRQPPFWQERGVAHPFLNCCGENTRGVIIWVYCTYTMDGPDREQQLSECMTHYWEAKANIRFMTGFIQCIPDQVIWLQVLPVWLRWLHVLTPKQVVAELVLASSSIIHRRPRGRR
jgi:hypothetical protein